MAKKMLKDLIEEKLGVKTDFRVDPLGVGTVGVAAVQVLPNNPNRVAWALVNLSANIIYLANDEKVAATNGTLLVANGGRASMLWSEDFDITSFGLWAIADGAASEFYLYEIIII